jgi:hypothetical protein
MCPILIPHFKKTKECSEYIGHGHKDLQTMSYGKYSKKIDMFSLENS